MIDNVEGVSEVRFPVHGDDRGSLIAVDCGKDIPFTIKRVYYIFGTRPGVDRGRHAHKDMNQVLVCVHGSCDVLLYDGENETVVTLDRPNMGIYIYGFVWREMRNFSEDCVLLVLVDKTYSETVYYYDKGQVKRKQNVKIYTGVMELGQNSSSGKVIRFIRPESTVLECRQGLQ